MAKTDFKGKTESETRTQVARLNYLHMTPRKVRLMANLIKGLPVSEAEAQLLFQRRRASKPLLKLLRSAKADAKNNLHLDPDYLFVSELRIDQGPMLKRLLPRARGTADPIQKKMSHIFMVLRENPDLKKPRFHLATLQKKIRLAPGERTERAEIKEKMPKPPRPKIKEKLNRPTEPGFFRRIFRRKSV